MPIFNIITDAGACFVSGNSPIYRRAGDHYIEVDSASLSPGMRILWEKEALKREDPEVRLEKFDRALEDRDDRYREAKNVIFEKNAHGVLIPKLRCEIIRSLGQGTLDDKVLRNNGNDFSGLEYRNMTSAVHEVVSSYAREHDISKGYEPNTIADWIKGEVKCPQNYRFLEALARLNPSNLFFMNAYESLGQSSGFLSSYREYVTARAGLMAYFSPERKVSGEKREGWTPSKGALSGKISIILELFGTEIGSKYFDAEITDVQRVRGKNEPSLEKRRPSEPHLFRGVYTGSEIPETRRVIKIQDISWMDGIIDQETVEHPDLALRRLRARCDEHGFPRPMVKKYLDQQFQGWEERMVRSVPQLTSDQGVTLLAESYLESEAVRQGQSLSFMNPQRRDGLVQIISSALRDEGVTQRGIEKGLDEMRLFLHYFNEHFLED